MRVVIFQHPCLFACSSLSPTVVLSLVTSRWARHGVVSIWLTRWRERTQPRERMALHNILGLHKESRCFELLIRPRRPCVGCTSCWWAASAWKCASCEGWGVRGGWQCLIHCNRGVSEMWIVAGVLAHSWEREVDDLLSKEVRVTRFVLWNSKQCSCNVYPFWGGGGGLHGMLLALYIRCVWSCLLHRHGRCAWDLNVIWNDGFAVTFHATCPVCGSSNCMAPWELSSHDVSVRLVQPSTSWKYVRRWWWLTVNASNPFCV